MSTITFIASDSGATPATTDLVREILSEQPFQIYRDGLEISEFNHRSPPMRHSPHCVFGVRLDDKLLSNNDNPAGALERLARDLWHRLAASGVEMAPKIWLRQIVTVGGADFERERLLHWGPNGTPRAPRWDSCRTGGPTPKAFLEPRPAP